MRWWRLLNALWLLLIVFIQVFWIDQLTIVWLRPNLLLVILINWLALSDWSRVRWWVIFVGLFLDCLAFYPFGSQTLLWFFTMGLANLLLVSFFTNKSLIAFSGLVIIVTIFHWFGRVIMSGYWLVGEWWLDLGGQILANWLVMVIIYALIYWFDRRFNPLFLAKRR